MCSQYKFWPTLVSQAAGTTSPAPATSGGFDLAAAHALLVRAIEQAPTEHPTAAGVKNRMRTLDPAFDEANYGYTRFRAFLDACPQVRVTGRSGSDITLALAETAAVAPPTGPCTGRDYPAGYEAAPG